MRQRNHARPARSRGSPSIQTIDRRALDEGAFHFAGRVPSIPVWSGTSLLPTRTMTRFTSCLPPPARQQTDIAMPRAVGISSGSATAACQSLWMPRTEAPRSLPVSAAQLFCILSKTRGPPGWSPDVDGPPNCLDAAIWTLKPNRFARVAPCRERRSGISSPLSSSPQSSS